MAESSDSVWPHGAPSIGETPERSRTVEHEDIERFTEISGDRNPLHYDQDPAQASQFGEIVVQGGVTNAILYAVVAHEMPGLGTEFLNVDWDFTARVRPGDTIPGSVEVTDDLEDKPITQLETTVTRGDGETVLKGPAVCYTMDVDG